MTTLMIDTIGANVPNIPRNTPKVAGYVTGIGDVPWNATEWALFPKSGKIRIRQLMTPYDPYDADAIDVEPGACTAQDAARWAHDRWAGRKWNSCVYVDAADAAATIRAVLASGVPAQFVQVWVADWALNQQGAEQMIGTDIQGCEVVAVQWASPSSNPNTVVPGGSGTLKALNLDLSVTRDNWFAYQAPTPPPPPPPQPSQITAQLKINRGGIAIDAAITSQDGGKTWQ